MLEELVEFYGTGTLMTVAGALVGLLFGAAAQRSQFCLRAATLEVADGRFGPRLAVWLLAFCAALALVQGAQTIGWIDVSGARALVATGSLSGAMIGGAMFGVGMVLARGCASRLLVLSATGNLRAIVTGLVLTLVAQAALRGVLSPAREQLAQLWLIPGGEMRSLSAWTGLGAGAVTVLASAGLVAAILLARNHAVSWSHQIAAIAVGAAVALGWAATFAIGSASFDVVQITSVTFTGPSADTLMGLVNAQSLQRGFGVGLVPGVFVGAAGMALMRSEWKIQRFGPDTPMERYLIGAVLMGFGSMLAGGCAVGAGLSGGAVLALTAWLAVFSMWIGAMITHRLLNRFGQQVQPA